LQSGSRASFVANAATLPRRRSRWVARGLNCAADLRSHPYKNYVIFFRYVGDVLEVIHIIEGHRDIAALFRDEESGEDH
jgi:hypothetical protein